MREIQPVLALRRAHGTGLDVEGMEAMSEHSWPEMERATVARPVAAMRRQSAAVVRRRVLRRTKGMDRGLVMRVGFCRRGGL